MAESEKLHISGHRPDAVPSQSEVRAHIIDRQGTTVFTEGNPRGGDSAKAFGGVGSSVVFGTDIFAQAWRRAPAAPPATPSLDVSTFESLLRPTTTSSNAESKPSGN